MSFTFRRDEARTLYWALEKLDAEEGLTDEESPLFKRIAEHVGESHGYDVSEEQRGEA